MSTALKMKYTYPDFIAAAHLDHHMMVATPSKKQVQEIVGKSLQKQALTIHDTALLLAASDPESQEIIFSAAKHLKNTVYGNRIVLFAPLYISSHCINDCQYCSFRRSNTQIPRKTLSLSEIENEVIALENQGHKRLIVVYGEHPHCDAQFMQESIRRIYQTTSKYGEIRRVNVNAAPLDHDGYTIVAQAGIGTYQVFMETYHHDTYRKYHPQNTPKGDYMYRLHALTRAMEAGLDDVGIGALFGLGDWRYEVLALVAHAHFLTQRFNCGPHTISVPRLRPAQGVSIDKQYLVSDEDFKRIVAIIRLAVPYTGLIVTAREDASLRRELLSYGVSQIDGGSNIELGGYGNKDNQQAHEQFHLADNRSLDDIMGELLKDGYLPSFCTACYRMGRTGEHFMEFAIPGFIKRYCTPNGLTTLMEYLVDYAQPTTKKLGLNLIQQELEQLPNDSAKQKLKQRLLQIQTGTARDLYL